MSVLAVIPARYGSTRFPGKPLHKIAGKMMVERVWRIAAAADGVDRVVVATDDTRILDAVEAAGGEAVMTDPACRNGTERALDALRRLKSDAEIIINVQGDAPLIPPWVIGGVAEALRADPSLHMATPAIALPAETEARMRQDKAQGSASGTTVVFNKAMDAMYFSKNVIPFRRKPGEGAPTYQHIGLYGYRRDALERLVALEPTPFSSARSCSRLSVSSNGVGSSATRRSSASRR
jgi:3-deoxy-manno-octulosonate cytidylyltransferase (CMP-KDO synthetase)